LILSFELPQAANIWIMLKGKERRLAHKSGNQKAGITQRQQQSSSSATQDYCRSHVFGILPARLKYIVKCKSRLLEYKLHCKYAISMEKAWIYLNKNDF
jgi:hypothetical protein